jgi:hypothetical protein
MDFKHHIEFAWRQTWERIVPLLLMTLVLLVVSVLTLGILAPVAMAGYMHSILRMVREGREPKAQDVFSQMHLWLPLLGFAVVAFVAIMVAFALFILPGFVVLFGIFFCCLYMLLLMTDRDMALMDAIKASLTMSTQDPLGENVVVALIFLGVSALGGSVLIGIGSLFTQPLATIFLVSIYEEKRRQMGDAMPTGQRPPRHS